MKSLITISVDTEVAIEAKGKIDNISSTVNEFLREYLQFKRENPGNTQEDLKNTILHQKAILAAQEQQLKRLEKQNSNKVIIDG